MTRTPEEIINDVQRRFPTVHVACKPSPAEGYVRVRLLGSRDQVEEAAVYALELAKAEQVLIDTEKVTQVMCKKSTPVATQPLVPGKEPACIEILDRHPRWGVWLLCINTDGHKDHDWDLPPG